MRDFHAANYVGDNIFIVGTGDVNHDELVDHVNQNFASLPKSSDVPVKNTEKPVFTPSLLFIRDDEMINSNVGVFYDAPGISHEDYFSFVLYKHMFGTYRID